MKRNRSHLAHLCAGAMARDLEVDIDGHSGRIRRMFIDRERERRFRKLRLADRVGLSTVCLEVEGRVIGLDEVGRFEREDGVQW